jgi:hypothetical protein
MALGDEPVIMLLPRAKGQWPLARKLAFRRRCCLIPLRV